MPDPKSSPHGGPLRLSTSQRAAAFARVAETRHITSSAFWGQPGLDKGVKPVKRDLPAFWSVGTHGQPFNDERLTDGASNHYKVVEPPKLGATSPKPAGPATECLATLKSSLQHGFAMFHDDSGLSPISMKPGTFSKLRQCVASSCRITLCADCSSLQLSGQSTNAEKMRCHSTPDPASATQVSGTVPAGPGDGHTGLGDDYGGG